MGKNYTRRVIGRGFTDTLDFFGWNRRTLVFLALWGVGTFIYGWVAGWDAATSEMLIATSYMLIPVGGLAVILLVYNLIVAPSRMQAEADDQIEELETTLAKISDKQSHVDELSDLLSDGISDIWNCPVATPEDLEGLASQWEAWQQKVINVLDNHFTYSDKIHFTRLGVIIPATRNDIVVPGHQKIIQEYALKEHRLREIIRDHNVTR